MAPNAAVSAGVRVMCLLLKEEIQKILMGISHRHSRKKRRFWVREWIGRRHRLGASALLLKELEVEDPETYKNHLRMSAEKFNELLAKIGNKIQKQDTHMRPAIPARMKLQITLRYLATGDSFASLSFMYRVPKNTISNFLKEVCEEIYDALQEYITVPQTQQEWKEIQDEFYRRWNFPNCCGALDGKHVNIRNPPNSGSEYFNYKGTFSVILFASVDAFPLKTFILKPYGRSTHLTKQKKIFNYRLSRARRIVENAFGILATRFRIFERPIAVSIDKIDCIIKTTCALHNWLRRTSEKYTPPGSFDTEDIDEGRIIPGSWRSEIGNICGLSNITRSVGNRNYSRDAAERRDKYAEYFAGIGAVPWQDHMIHDGNPSSQ